MVSHHGWVTLSVQRSSSAVIPTGLRPRYVTLRDESRKTMGPAVGRVQRALGQQPMPWQEYVADVGGEVDANGLHTYSLVIVSIQRQAGKTTLDLSQSVQRSLARPARKVWHTAQTGQDARKKWAESVDALMASPLSSLVAGRPRRTNGAEALTFVNGSIFRPHPPTRDALHGEQSDLNNIDEGWVFTEAEGADLLQAITPTQLTRPGAQTWVWSTRGDAESTWFHGLIDMAREGALPGVALFDFGIPDDADPMDLETIAHYHPAFGHTVTMDSLRRAQASMADKPGEFARAFGNRPTGAREPVFPPACWEAGRLRDADGQVADLPPGRPVYGAAVSRDGSVGALAVAVLGADGLPYVELLEHRPGRHWLAEKVKRLRDAGQGVVVDRRGPAGPVADQLELAGVELIPLTTLDYATACQDLWDRLCDDAAQSAGPRIRLREHPELDAAALLAGRRLLREGGWVFSRRESTGDVAALEAATLAAWGVARAPEVLTIGRSLFLAS
jgi:hypothetical protein